MMAERLDKRTTRAFAILAASIMFLSLAFVLSHNALAQTYPTVSLTIVRIQEIDPIDEPGSEDWDWYYWVGVYNNSSWNWTSHEAPDGADVVVNELHEFEVRQSKFFFGILLCERDFLTMDDYADISNHSLGGGDDVTCDPTLVSFPAGAYYGAYDLVTGNLSGYQVVSEPQGNKTSGDFDGNPGDENDANLWFTISDDYEPPVADAGPPQSGSMGQTIVLNGSGSNASDGSSIEKYEWDFDMDGTYDASGVTVATTFQTIGTHSVRLRVTDSIGRRDWNTTTVEIVNLDPTAVFTYGPHGPMTFDVVDFTDSSTDPDGTIASWHWDFGDGTTSDEKNPTHAYDDDGEYDVVLIVTDNHGSQDSESTKITVINREPVADFNFTTAEPVVEPTTEDYFVFTDLSTDEDGTIESWEWVFGDGHTSDLPNPLHRFEIAGAYMVQLTVTDDDGDEDTVTMDITVKKAEEEFLPGFGIFGIFMIVIVIILVIVVALIAIPLLRRSRKKGPEQPQEPPEEAGQDD
jgi:PKD repeat protein